MKIMDISSEDEECQIEAVIDSKAKKTKQARLPFQTLTTDSPIANKKRKSPRSPDCRNSKQAKVTTKENSFEVLKKTDSGDIVITEEKIVEKKEESSNEIDDTSNNSKQVSVVEAQDSKTKKTPGKGLAKGRKSESKTQVNSLTKFFKKIENKNDKESQNKSQISTTNSIAETSKINSNINNKLNQSLENQAIETIKNKNTDNLDSSEVPDDQNAQNSQINKNRRQKVKESISNCELDHESKTQSDESNDIELKESSNDENEQDMSCLNKTENMDVDSDNSLSDDSHDDDDDDDCDKSDTDDKKTEHEETDSRDDTNKNNEAESLTPTRRKLLNNSKVKKLTPKQLEKKLEIQKQRENRAKQRLEREKKLQEERENRKKEKEEKRREREEKERLLKEQKKKEKELKELKKQAEIEQKQKEKEAKEEDRRKREEAKEEEKKRKEEERLEAERKKQKAVSNFVSFFVAKKPTETKHTEENIEVEGRNFMPFEIKADMRVAPLIRRTLNNSEKSKLNKLINSCVNKSDLYINELKNKAFAVRKSERTWPFEANDDIILLEDDESSNIVQPNNMREKYRAKLLMFEENRRPPYWGTWRKKSKTINPRQPFAKDTQWFDYEIDSDEEWEEEEPGESLRGSDDEKDEEHPEENEYDVDNDFMVPHGYLSEEEIVADEEDEDDELNPEKQETKLKILGEQFEAERNTKTTKLKPKVIGCVWINKNNEYPENTPTHTVQFLTSRQAWIREIPLTLTAPADADNLENECGTPVHKQNVVSSARKAKAMEEAMPDLIRLLHGNTHGRGFLIKEFLVHWCKKKEKEKAIPKAKLHQKIQEIATWTICTEPGPMYEKSCWHVAEEYQTKYLGTEKLSLPNQWTYSLIPKKKNVINEVTEKPDEKEKEKKNVPLITQFTKMLSTEEMQKQLAEKASTPTSKLSDKTSVSTSASKATPPLNRPPKRASLISVPRGEPFPKSPRVSLIDKFVTKDNSAVKDKPSTNSNKNNKSIQNDTDGDDCLIIDNSDDKIIETSIFKKTDIIKTINSELDYKGDQNKNVKNEEKNNESHNISANSDIEIIKN